MDGLTSIGTPWLWTIFAVLVVVALAIDLIVMNRRGAHHVGFREAAIWSLVWIALALAFNIGLWLWLREIGDNAVADRIALEFLTGYLIEKALAMDNLFVFLLLFTHFSVPIEQRQRVLVYGIIGAIVLRAILIFIGAALIARFHWILYVFGVFLVLTGGKMLFSSGEPPALEKNAILRWVRGRFPLTTRYYGDAFRVRLDGRRVYTPLFLVLVLVGVTDVIFAVDSIPAIFAITLDPFIVLTSNVFAVLGLRALFFLLAGLADRFHLLGYGLALTLAFIGIKMLMIDLYKIPVGYSLLVVALLIGGAMVLSLLRPRQHDPDDPPLAGRPPG